MPLYFNHGKIGGIAVKTNSASGTDTGDGTVTSGAQILSPFTAYSKGVKYTGSIPSKAAATITPGTTDQKLSSGQYLSGDQTIQGDANLIPGNIKSGVSIFGVRGTLDVQSSGGEVSLQEKSVTPSESAQTVTPDSGYDGLSAVNVGAISSTYVGSAVPTKGAKTITPSTDQQTAVSGGTYVTDDVTVDAMPSGALSTPSVNASGLVTAKVGTSGYLAAGEQKTLQLPTQGAQTITPGASAQTIASGSFLTGSQTIQGDANLVAGNIKSGVSIFGVAGSYEGEGSSGGPPSTIVAGDTPVLSSSALAATITSTSMKATGISVTIAKAGTYRFKFSAGRTSTSGTWTTQLYKNGSAVSGATATWSSYQGTCTADVSCSAGDVIQIYGRSRSTSYRLIVGQLVACIDWDTGL